VLTAIAERLTALARQRHGGRLGGRAALIIEDIAGAVRRCGLPDPLRELLEEPLTHEVANDLVALLVRASMGWRCIGRRRRRRHDADACGRPCDVRELAQSHRTFPKRNAA
jgi:hypothetical protein